GGRNDGVQARRALAATEDEQAQRTGALREALRGRRQRGDLAPHWIADALCARPRGETRWERFEHAARESRQHPIRHARYGVLLVNHERPAREPRGNAAGPRYESARAEHDRGST